RGGAPWRDLPKVFGEWNSVFRRFSRWSQKGVWQRIFEALSDDPDFEYLIIDSTIVRAHQHASGAKRGIKIRPSDARAAAWAPKSTWQCAGGGVLYASFSLPVRKVTPRRQRPFWRAPPPSSSSAIPLTMPITSAKQLPRKAPRPSFQTTLRARSSIR